MNSDDRPSPIERYFEYVDSGDVDAATALFSESCSYIRPPAPSADGAGGGGLESIVGRPAVKEFLDRRGRIALVHEISSVMADERQCFVEGTARFLDSPGGASSVFVAHAVLDSAGLMANFLAISAPTGPVSR